MLEVLSVPLHLDVHVVGGVLHSLLVGVELAIVDVLVSRLDLFALLLLLVTLDLWTSLLFIRGWGNLSLFWRLRGHRMARIFRLVILGLLDRRFAARLLEERQG